MDIYLNTGHTFAVPAAVADHLLRLASHDQLKVLLFVLCHAGETLTHEQIARACSVRAEGVEEALAFWQDANILGSVQKLPGVQLAAGQPAEATEAVKPPVSRTEAAAPQPQRAAVFTGSAGMNLMPSEIAARKENDPAMAELFAETERRAGRLLTQSEFKSLIWMHEYLGLPPDVIMMLAAYCREIDAFAPNYMEKIAWEWAERGVTTHELVQQDIRRREENRSFTGQIMKIFGMKKRPTPKQQAFADAWQGRGISTVLIRIAYEKTRDATGDEVNLNTFKYVDKILTRWAGAGITDAEAARQDDEAYQAAKQQKKTSGKEKKAGTSAKNAGASSFDADDLEKLINQF